MTEVSNDWLRLAMTCPQQQVLPLAIRKNFTTALTSLIPVQAQRLRKSATTGCTWRLRRRRHGWRWRWAPRWLLGPAEVPLQGPPQGPPQGLPGVPQPCARPPAAPAAAAPAVAAAASLAFASCRMSRRTLSAGTQADSTLLELLSRCVHRLLPK